MRSFVFHAEFEPGAKRGVVVSFPDVPEAITQGDDMADARAMAEEALGMALLSYLARGLPLPKAKARGRDMVPVPVAPDVAAKLAVLEAFARPASARSSSPAVSARTRRKCAAYSIRGIRPSCRHSRRRCACSESASLSRWRRRPSSKPPNWTYRAGPPGRRHRPASAKSP